MQSRKVQKVSAMLQGKTCVLFMLPAIKKLKMAAKEWTDDKTFRFRNDLLWAGPGGDNVLWAKAF